MDRYEVKYGRFGAYFFDKEQNRDVDLNEALLIMNNRIHDWIKFGEALGGEYKR